MSDDGWRDTGSVKQKALFSLFDHYDEEQQKSAKQKEREKNVSAALTFGSRSNLGGEKASTLDKVQNNK